MKDRISFIRDVLAYPLAVLVPVAVFTYMLWTHTETGKMLILLFREFPYYLPV